MRRGANSLHARPIEWLSALSARQEGRARGIGDPAANASRREAPSRKPSAGSYPLNSEHIPSASPATGHSVKTLYTEDKRLADFYYHPFAYYAVRPVSFPLAALLINLGWSANFATLVGFAILLVGLAAIAFGAWLPGLVVFGAVLLNVWYVSDAVDGNIARYLRAQSPAGGLLDSVVGHFFHVLTPVAVGLALSGRGLDVLGLSALTLGLLSGLVEASRSSTSAKTKAKLPARAASGPLRVRPIAHLAYALVSLKAPTLLGFALFDRLDLWLIFYTALSACVWAFTTTKALLAVRRAA